MPIYLETNQQPIFGPDGMPAANCECCGTPTVIDICCTRRTLTNPAVFIPPIWTVAVSGIVGSCTRALSGIPPDIGVIYDMGIFNRSYSLTSHEGCNHFIDIPATMTGTRYAVDGSGNCITAVGGVSVPGFIRCLVRTANVCRLELGFNFAGGGGSGAFHDNNFLNRTVGGDGFEFPGDCQRSYSLSNDLIAGNAGGFGGPIGVGGTGTASVQFGI